MLWILSNESVWAQVAAIMTPLLMSILTRLNSEQEQTSEDEQITHDESDRAEEFQSLRTVVGDDEDDENLVDNNNLDMSTVLTSRSERSDEKAQKVMINRFSTACLIGGLERRKKMQISLF